jgi:hypothetical protein
MIALTILSSCTYCIYLDPSVRKNFASLKGLAEQLNGPYFAQCEITAPQLDEIRYVVKYGGF